MLQAGCTIVPTAASRRSSRVLAQAVEQMIAWCRVGPARARVDAVEVIAEPVQDEVGFVVR